MVKEAAASKVSEVFKSVGADASGSAKSRSSGPNQSVRRILDATLETLARQGLQSLSMTDVCRAAGVARGTLYRYFPTKESLLEGIGEQVRAHFEDGLKAVCDETHSGKERFQAVMEFLVVYSRSTRGDRLLEVEPGFVLQFFARNMQHYSEIMADALQPFFEEIQTRTGGEVHSAAWAELILRANLSFFLIEPHAGGPDLLDEMQHLLHFLTEPA
tara:strand:- start:6925 stop:7572 length:648 start_codon:yes stop_codon:yes gene_type:complete